MRPFVERFRYISESLLPGRIPNIQRYRLSVVLDALDLKVNPDSAQVITLETVLTVPHQ